MDTLLEALIRCDLQPQGLFAHGQPVSMGCVSDTRCHALRCLRLPVKPEEHLKPDNMRVHLGLIRSAITLQARPRSLEESNGNALFHRTALCILGVPPKQHLAGWPNHVMIYHACNDSECIHRQVDGSGTYCDKAIRWFANRVAIDGMGCLLGKHGRVCM